MHKFQKSSSGILLTKINNFNNLRNGYAFNKNCEKISHLEFDIEKQKEIMVKLKLDLNTKNKELKELLSKNKKQKNKQNKTINIIQEILKIIDKKKEGESKINSPKLKIETDIESNIVKDIKDTKEKEKDLVSINNINTISDDNETYNKTNTKTFYTTNNNFTNNINHVLPKIKSPKIKSKLFINTNTFMKNKKLKNKLYMNTLRNKISTLNEKLSKKNEEILDYKSKQDEKNIKSNFENTFLDNYDEIKKLKLKNAEMCAKIEDFAENYFLEKEENIKLKKQLKDFIDIYNAYKENIEKNNLELEKKLKYFEEKNLECIIFHMNKFKNMSRYYEDNKSKLTEAGNRIEKINEEINEINNDITIKNKIFIKHKTDIENLNNKINNIKENMEKNKMNMNNMIIKIEESNKNNIEKKNLNKKLKNEFKEKKNKYKNNLNNIKEINNIIKEKDKEINELKEQIKKLKASKNIFYY